MADVTEMRNALSIDVEEYFQVEAFRGFIQPGDWTGLESRVVPSTSLLLDLLDEHDVRGTFFVVGWVAERHPALVRDIGARGHELGCHGYWHRPIYAMSPGTFREDVRRAKSAIEEAVGRVVVGYRAPTASIVRDTRWALDILAEEGFCYDSSIFPIHHDRYGIPDAPRFPHRIPLRNGGTLLEFPMSTLRIGGQNLPFCGGGYFRLLPCSLIAAGIRRLNAGEHKPAMVYLHPWELDPAQPRFPVPPLTRFRHYVNLKHTVQKLARLLEAFTFAPLGDVLRDAGLVEAAA